MSVPFYVPPEQLVKDRAEFARKGIARGRSIVAIEYDEGILILAENPSDTLHKISEIYDRVAFAGVGKFNEFEQLRIGGIRRADLTGYAYSRSDVNAKSLANAYAQTLGLMKRLVAELGLTILFCEHDMGMVFSIADRIMVMQQGRTLVEDTPEAVRNNPRVQEAYLGGSAPC